MCRHRPRLCRQQMSGQFPDRSSLANERTKTFSGLASDSATSGRPVGLPAPGGITRCVGSRRIVLVLEGDVLRRAILAASQAAVSMVLQLEADGLEARLWTTSS